MLLTLVILVIMIVNWLIENSEVSPQVSARQGATGAHVTQVVPKIASGGGDADPYPFSFTFSKPRERKSTASEVSQQEALPQ